jgi:hypothetical protein
MEHIYFTDLNQADLGSSQQTQDDLNTSGLGTHDPREAAYQILESLRKCGGGDDGCGVGMFVEVEEGAEGDEVYMPAPDLAWLW